MTGWRGVDDDQVVVAGEVTLVDGFEGEVVVAAGETIGEVAVERVGDERLRGGLVG